MRLLTAALRPPLHSPGPLAGRALRQQPSAAFSSAKGANSASASARAGPGFAQTQQTATGPGSQVQGVSQVRAPGFGWVIENARELQAAV